MKRLCMTLAIAMLAVCAASAGAGEEYAIQYDEETKTVAAPASLTFNNDLYLRGALDALDAVFDNITNYTSFNQPATATATLGIATATSMAAPEATLTSATIDNLSATNAAAENITATATARLPADTLIDGQSPVLSGGGGSLGSITVADLTQTGDTILGTPGVGAGYSHSVGLAKQSGGAWDMFTITWDSTDPETMHSIALAAIHIIADQDGFSFDARGEGTSNSIAADTLTGTAVIATGTAALPAGTLIGGETIATIKAAQAATDSAQDGRLDSLETFESDQGTTNSAVAQSITDIETINDAQAVSLTDHESRITTNEGAIDTKITDGALSGTIGGIDFQGSQQIIGNAIEFRDAAFGHKWLSFDGNHVEIEPVGAGIFFIDGDGRVDGDLSVNGETVSEAVKITETGLQFTDTASTTAADSGCHRLESKSDGVYVIDPLGAETGPLGSGLTTIDSDTTVYVAATGSDSTGDGSSGNPYYSINGAIDGIAGWNIINGAFITIAVAAGHYTWDEQLITTPLAPRIKIIGDIGSTTLDTSSPMTVTGSTGDWTIVLPVTTTDAVIGDYIGITNYVNGSTALGTEIIYGVHEITGVSASEITVISNTAGSTCDGDNPSSNDQAATFQTVVDFSNASGIQVSGTKLYMLQNLCLIGDGSGGDDECGIVLNTGTIGGSDDFDGYAARVGLKNWYYGIRASYNSTYMSKTTSPGTFIDNCRSSCFRAYNASTITNRYGVATGHNYTALASNQSTTDLDDTANPEGLSTYQAIYSVATSSE